MNASAAAAPAPAAAEGMRDLRGPVPVPDGSVWLWVALGLAAVALLAGAWGWWRRRRRAAAVPPSAAQTAFEAIARLRRDAARTHPEAHAAAIAAVLRAYLESRYGVAAPRQTTPELLRSLSESRGPLAGLGPALERFLSACDAAKFARASLPEAERLGLCAAAEEWVHAAESCAALPAPPPAGEEAG